VGSKRVETVRRMFERARPYWLDGRTAPEAVYEGFAADLEYTPVPNYPEYRQVSGLAGFIAFAGDMAASWGGVDVELMSVEEHPGAVTARVMMRAGASPTRPAMEGRLFAVFSFRGDEVVRIEDFLSAAEARGAARAHAPESRR
jgi:hypothetical protein